MPGGPLLPPGAKGYQAVLWARADSTEALNASYTELARVLQLPQRDAQEQDVIVQTMKHWFSRNQEWLLVLDNADDLALVQAFLPPSGQGHLVLTTRAHTTGKMARSRRRCRRIARWPTC